MSRSEFSRGHAAGSLKILMKILMKILN